MAARRRRSYSSRNRYNRGPSIYQMMEMQYAQRRLTIICIALITIPLVLCGISYWGILIQGVFSGSESAGVYIPRLIGALIAFGLSTAWAVLYAWNADEYTYLKSLPVAYIVCVVAMFIEMLIFPLELPGIVNSSVFLGLARLVVNCILAISGAACPALLACAVGWAVRYGYFLLKPED